MANDDFTVIVNNPVQLPCEAIGVPPPTIHWMKAGVNLTRKDPGVIFLPNGAMRINRVQTTDGGVYECIATSIAGFAKKALTLVVQGNSWQILIDCISVFCSFFFKFKCQLHGIALFLLQTGTDQYLFFPYVSPLTFPSSIRKRTVRMLQRHHTLVHVILQNFCQVFVKS